MGACASQPHVPIPPACHRELVSSHAHAHHRCRARLCWQSRVPSSPLVPTRPGVLLLGWRLLRFRRWRDETAQVPRFLVCFLVMLAELTIENCVVW